MARSEVGTTTARKNEEVEEGGDGIWGTWEELLLASAVCRHGTSRWESVAVEVGSRCSWPHLLTPERCRERYHELRQRFEGAVTDGGGGGRADDDEGETEGEMCGGAAATAAVPWLEELRRLRVDELRREVERYDESIGSLQLKVKRLKEERERSLRESGSSSGRAGDPDKNGDTNRPGSSSSPPGGGSTQPPCGVVDQAAAAGGGKRAAESPDKPNAREHDGPAGVNCRGDEEKPGAAGEEGSFDGSSDTVSKGDRPQRAAGGSPSPDVADAVTPAASGEAAPMTANGRGAEPELAPAKEISDVQSSASPSRSRRPTPTEEASASASASATASRAGSGCDEAEADDESPLRHRGTATTNKSPHLAALLETVRSSKYGSVFERRLPVQEGARYQSIIRQHIDLKTIQRRVQEASYSRLEFRRDLLLLCNNAVVFFPKGSEEHAAAVHLRGLINKKFASSSGDGKPSSVPPKVSNSAAIVRQPMQLSMVKAEETTSPSLLEKPSLLPSLIACKKRSSITSKAAATSEEKAEEKPNVVRKVTEGVGFKVEEKPVVRGLRTTKARGPPAKTANPNLIKAAASFGAKTIPADDAMELLKAERKSDADSTASESPVSVSAAVQTAPAAAKKKGAAVFLKRMKSPESASSQKRAEPEQKKGGKVDERKDKAPRQGDVTKLAPGPSPSPPVKRKGRPPKRPALVSPPQPPAKKGRPADAEVPLRQRGSTTGKREKR